MYEDENCDEGDDTDLDPRIQIELEKLNSTTTEINSLEGKLDEANTAFRILLNDSIKNLKALSKKLGGCIEKARPYYDALETLRKAQMDCQRAAVLFQRANEIHQAAKETVALAEQRFLSRQHEWKFDSAWQEMLNHATIKVMEAETQKTESEMEHQKRTLIFNQAEKQLHDYESKLRKSISKSKPYFEEKELCQKNLASQKEKVEFLQKQLILVKNSYSLSLKNLEKISEEIHSKRGTIGRGIREPGVGAETKTIVEMDLENLNIQCKKAEAKIRSLNTGKPVVGLLDKNHVNKYLCRLDKCSGASSLDLNYEMELDRCDLQSLGSQSITTGSALSEEEYIDNVCDIDDYKEIPGT